MREDKFNEINGFLKAFKCLNLYCNHGCSFYFDSIDYEGDLKSTLLSYLRKQYEFLKKNMINYNHEFKKNFNFQFKPVKNLEDILSKGLEYYFLGVFSSDYTEKYSYVSEQRKYCITSFIKMIKEFFINHQFDVWASGIENYSSSLTEYYCECSGMDFIFLCENKLYILHLAIND